MKIMILGSLFLFLGSFTWSQEMGNKISYPTSLRMLKAVSSCSNVTWRKYDTGLEYVEIKMSSKHCQQFNDYFLPLRKNTQARANRTWKSEQSKNPTSEAILIGQHFEIITETESFVQIYNGTINRFELEKEVQFQCEEWIKYLGMIELSENLPKECKDQ